LSEINQRRWQTFKSRKRAYISLILFCSLFIVSLFSEFIANDKPFLIKYEGRYFFPFVQTLTEADFGGDFEMPVKYGDAYILDNIEQNGWALWPFVRYSHDTTSRLQNTSFPAPPSSEHILGTDDKGKDIFARILYGVRLSVLFGLALTVCGSAVGIFAGVVQGYFGGAVDLWFQRFMEVWGGIPTLYLIIIISSMFKMTFWLLLGILLLFSWMRLVGVVRMESLKTRNMDYVKAARSLGAGDFRIMLKHVLPNALIAVITFLPFQINASITSLTALDFLGFGISNDYPSLGELINQGKTNLFAPWIGITVFCVLSFMLTTLVMIGEGVRDAFDPKVFMKRGKNR
jgi:microcin C transport system permease protein